MPSPTKPTTNLTREELEKQVFQLTADTGQEFMKTKVLKDWTLSKDIMQLIDTYAQAKEREARLNELASADTAMDSSGINEMEEWEDYYKERTAELTSGKEESMRDTVLAIDTIDMTNEEKKLINDNLFELL